MLLVLLALTSSNLLAGTNPLVFRNGFEGDELPAGAQISGRVLSDPNGDGDLADGVGIAGATVYLDRNFNGSLDAGEPSQASDPQGNYRFAGLGVGLKHVRQALPVPNVQTFPAGGILPAADGLPDEVTEYLHAAAGIGDYDAPYGKLATVLPAEWDEADTRPLPELIDSLDLVLQPRGERTRVVGLNTSKGAEALSLPQGASLTVGFDEAIVDGPGADFAMYTIGSGSVDEVAELFVGSSPGTLQSLGMISFVGSVNSLDIDLSAHAVTGPVHYLRLVAQDNGGTWKGFEITAFEAFNFALPDPAAHVVEVLALTDVFTDRDFGRSYQDLPPSLTLGITDLDTATPGLRVGEALQVQVDAFDDLGISSLVVSANGQPLQLDADRAVTLTPATAGELVLQTTATDTAQQSTQREARYAVLNADGSSPFNPNTTGVNQSSGPNAPSIKLLSPAAGDSVSADVALIASISGNPTHWQVDLAPVDAIDPYTLAAPDPSYQTLASGSGNVFSASLATLPLASLADGIYFVRVSAQNAAGRVAYAGQVIARNVAPELLRPQVSIESPSQGSALSLTVDVIGSITSTRSVREWYVDVAPREQVDLLDLGSEQPPWRRIAQGSGVLPTGSLLASFDGTRFVNGSYVLRIVARNDIGLGWAEPLPLEVTGEAKLGRNRLEFVDIDIELAGFPLRLTRVYDSLAAERSSDFGFGWSLSLQDTDIRETVPTTGQFGIFGATPFRVGARVYLTAPDGRRLGFTFAVDAGTPGPLGTPYRPRFDADPGSYYRLEVPNVQTTLLDLRSDGTVNLFGIGFPYNPSTYALTDPRGNRYTVHETDGLLRAEDSNGLRLDFSDSGIVHSAGPRLVFGRDAEERITSITDPDGNLWSYTYDGNGDLAASTDPDLNTVVYSYSQTRAHYLDGIIDPQGRLPRRFEYDPDDGRLIATIDEDGQRSEALFDPAGFSGTLTDARGHVTTLEYNARGNVTRVTNPKGDITESAYTDPANPDRETQFTDAEGGVWSATFDSMGRLTILRTPLATGTAQRFEIDYDALGNVTRFEDPDNRVDSFSFDAAGNRLQETPFDGVAASYRYGAQGQLLERSVGSYAMAFEYDVFGFPAGQSDSTGFELSLDHLRNGRMVERRDNRDQLNVEYSGAGRLRRQTDSDGAEVMQIDNADGSITRTDRNAQATRIAFDADRRPTRIESPEGDVLVTTFDASGNPGSVTDALGNRTEFVFDSTNRLERVIDATLIGDLRVRDGNGNITEQIDRNGKRRTFEWDANQRIRFERWFDEGNSLLRETEFIYDSQRGLSQVDDRIGGVLHRIRYAGRLPRVTQVTYELPGQSPWLLRYQWDTHYAAPDDLRLGTSIVDTQARISVEPYAAKSSRLRWQHPQSALDNQVQLIRDPLGQLSLIRRLTGSNGGNAIAETLIEYDAQGRPRLLRHQHPGGLPLHPNSAISFTWDAERQRLSETTAGNTVTYGYDGNGQLRSATHSNPAYADESYTYDAAGNRLTSHLIPAVASIGVGNRHAASGSQQWQHDAAGNLIERLDTASGRITAFAYDHRNRLVSAISRPSLGAPADTTLAFEYDYLDRPLYREINGARTWLIHDREHLFAEFADGASTLSAAHLYDPNLIDTHYAVWRSDALGERWLFTDTLGSVRGISNASFGIQSWVEYDSFGQRQPGSTPAQDEPLGFAGRYWLAPLGLYENRRRYYAPDLGRFTQEDPSLFAGGDANLYRYAFNNPLNFRDPTGEVAALEFALDLVETLVDAKEQADSLEVPCKAAKAVAAKFAYFRPLAKIISNPTSASGPPVPDPPLSLAPPGCAIYFTP
jgi:RHS repeat-associated protein